MLTRKHLRVDRKFQMWSMTALIQWNTASVHPRPPVMNTCSVKTAVVQVDVFCANTSVQRWLIIGNDTIEILPEATYKVIFVQHCTSSLWSTYAILEALLHIINVHLPAHLPIMYCYVIWAGNINNCCDVVICHRMQSRGYGTSSTIMVQLC